MSSDIIPQKGLVVSCQALPDEPLHGSRHMVAMAKAAKIGGAVAIRANGPKDITAIKQAVHLPVIGLNKRNVAGFDVFITPTVEDALAVSQAGADIVAIDGTERPRPDGYDLKETIDKLHERGIVVMADISTLEEGARAADWGADFVSTTLSGYTDYSRQADGPDFALVSHLADQLSVPVVAEGKIWSPEEAVQALEQGADFVVIGSAITRPQLIVARYTQEIHKQFTKT